MPINGYDGISDEVFQCCHDDWTLIFNKKKVFSLKDVVLVTRLRLFIPVLQLQLKRPLLDRAFFLGSSK